MTTFSLILIGDEILSGKRVDKHLPKTIELLGERGLQLAGAEIVGDDPARITAVLRRAFERAASGEVVFSCGGIGATPDDHTRQCAAAALGRRLHLHPQAAELIHERARDMALEKGGSYDPDQPDNVHRLNMGVFPEGAEILPNPYNKIPGFSIERVGGGAPTSTQGAVHFMPGFPIMAWPMMESLLDTKYAHLHARGAWGERSIIVYGAMEAVLTPLMEAIEAGHPGVKVFSLPSVDHPEHGRHIELGVKGVPTQMVPAYEEMLASLQAMGCRLGPELVRIV
ncbi:competence/damage-inducible protein A [Hylemonella gracilis]|uniref:Competence/damage-inducible protein A n=1 Tax=Hylemonella gracilis TaxID=80880 RepID=A0A4P6UJF9_9BURK|nr:molybdopterin-binding protein [Hylemonella gracilis]QBK05173.1 competence/damage-inducible protein A [Hylemonella gracilis]